MINIPPVDPERLDDLTTSLGRSKELKMAEILGMSPNALHLSQERQGLLEDILAHPEDDGPRLIYADWLEDNGDAARAEFIRVQIKLARADLVGVRADGQYVTPTHEWAELHQRAVDLMETHRKTWLADAPFPIDAWSLDEPMVQWNYEIRCLLRRGFVDEISISLKRFLKDAAALGKYQPITKITIYDIHVFQQTASLDGQSRSVWSWLVGQGAVGRGNTDAFADLLRLMPKYHDSEQAVKDDLSRAAVTYMREQAKLGDKS